jgi:predicted TPR repeat methyltransferase
MADEGTRHKGLSDISRKSTDVAQYYDNWADDYEATLADWHYQAPDRVAATLRSELAAEAVILDAGCGTGLSGRALQAAGFTTIDGIDVSSRSLEQAQTLGVYRSLQHLDMQQMPFPIADDAYDGLVCVGVLTYLPDSAGTLREFSRIVKPGGMVVVTQRSDLFVERDFRQVLQQLVADGTIQHLNVSDARPYLPGNKEFGDRILVHYVSYTVG